jgi:hypothetical protein
MLLHLKTAIRLAGKTVLILLALLSFQLIVAIPYVLASGVEIFNNPSKKEFIVYAVITFFTALFLLMLAYDMLQLFKNAMRLKIRETLFGLLLGILIPFIICASIWLFSELDFIKGDFDLPGFFFYIPAFFFLAMIEEVLCRFIILERLNLYQHPYATCFISSFTFSVLHLFNPSISVLGFINIFLFGLNLSLVYYMKRNLWLVICFHAAWNFFAGCVLGSPVSGIIVPSLYKYEVSGGTFISGSDFGIEGSIFTSLFLFFSLIFLIKKIRIMNGYLRGLKAS